MHPWLLVSGLLAISIPIAIHFLMRRQRKPVRWAAMRFVIEAYRKQRSRIRLEQLLLLTMRCLLVACIAFALARPVLMRAGLLGSGSRDLYLLIDTSIASAVRSDQDLGEAVTELDASVASALSLLKTLDAARGDRAAVIVLGSPARGIVLPPSSDLAQVERVLRHLSPTDSTADWIGASRLVSQAIAQEKTSQPHKTDPLVAVFSGFREGTVLTGQGAVNFGSPIQILASTPTDRSLSNVGIERVSMLRPVVVTGSTGATGQDTTGDTLFAPGMQLRIMLERSGRARQSRASSVVTVLAGVDRAPVGNATIQWEAGQSSVQATVDLDLSAIKPDRAIVLEARIDRDANDRDNRAWAVLHVRDQLRVAILGTRRFSQMPSIEAFTPSDWLGLAFAPAQDEGKNQIEVEVFDAARFSSAQLRAVDAVCIVEPQRLGSQGWDAIGQFRARGGMVLLTPARADGAQLWTDAATKALGLDWTWAREPIGLADEDQSLLATEPGPVDLFWFVRSELPALLEPVHIRRILAVDIGHTLDSDSASDSAVPRPLIDSDHDAHASRVLLATRSGVPLVAASLPQDNAGAVVYIATAFDLDWTDLPARPLIVPILQELLRSGVGEHLRNRPTIAGTYAQGSFGAVEFRSTPANATVLPKGVDRTDRAALDGTHEQESVFAVDPATGRTRQALTHAGVFDAFDAAGGRVGTLLVEPDALASRAGLTTRDRVERFLAGDSAPENKLIWLDAASRFDRLSKRDQAIRKADKSSTQSSELAAASSSSSGSGLGIGLLWFALALAAAEMFFARLVSHAAIATPSGSPRTKSAQYQKLSRAKGAS